MTPTQFLRQAALKSGWIWTPTVWQPRHAESNRQNTAPRRKGSDGHVWTMLPDVDCEDVDDDLCWLCGGETEGLGQPLKDRLKLTFTDVDLAKAPWSNSFCRGCAFCLSWKVLATNGYLATDDGLQFVGRSQWRDILAGEPPKRYLACIPTSGQKWLHYKAKVVQSGRWGVQFEDVWVELPDAFPEVLEVIERLYTGGFSKAEIQSGEYQSHRIQTYGVSRWETDEWKISAYRGSRMFQLAVFVAQKEGQDT